jgi:hypothetical protein
LNAPGQLAEDISDLGHPFLIVSYLDSDE